MSRGMFPILDTWTERPASAQTLSTVILGDLNSGTTDVLFALMFRGKTWNLRLQASASVTHAYSYDTSGGVEAGTPVNWHVDQTWTWDHNVDRTYSMAVATVADEVFLGIEDTGDGIANILFSPVGQPWHLSPVVYPDTVDNVTGTYTEFWTKTAGATGVGSTYTFTSAITPPFGSSIGGPVDFEFPILVEDDNYLNVIHFIYFDGNSVGWGFVVNATVSPASGYSVTRNFGLEPNPPISIDTTGDDEFAAMLPGSDVITNINVDGTYTSVGTISIRTPAWRAGLSSVATATLYTSSSVNPYSVTITLSPATCYSWDGLWNSNGTANSNPLTS